MRLARTLLLPVYIALLNGCGGNAAGTSVNPPLTSTLANYTAPVVTVTKYPLPAVRSLCFNEFRGWLPCSVNPGPHGIVEGKDGALWFTQLVYSCVTSTRPPQCSGAVGRSTTSGVITRYALKNQARPWDIAAGSDGALWFTEQTVNKIGRISLGGTATEYAIPAANGSPVGITAGSDGALWFLENSSNSKVVRISTSGKFTEYVIPSANSNPFTIVAGSDGALWFGEYGASKIGRITTSGVITEYSTPTKSSGPYSVTRGADGAVWFAEIFVNKIGRIATNGKITEYPATFTDFSFLTNGPQSKLWFTQTPTSLGSMTTSGTLTQYALSTGVYNSGVTTGPDGALWFTDDDAAGAAIARVHPPSL